LTAQVETTAPPTEPPRTPHRIPWWANPRLGLVVLLVLLMTLFSVIRPAFLDTRLTLTPLQSDISVYLVVGLAQLCVLSLGHMNMAVGRMAATSAFTMGLVHHTFDGGLLVSLLAGLLVGALLGAVAGLIISRTGVNSFVVTLAMDFALVGLITILYTSAVDGVAFPTMPAGMTALRFDTFADYCAGEVCGPRIPLVVPFAIAAALLAGLLFRWSRVGREILMTGANLRAAELSGIPTRSRVVQAHALSGLFAGLAGFLLAANSGAFSAGLGDSLLLPSFLAPVLGGTLLAGGSVSVLGTVLGAALTQVIYKGLNLLQFELDQLQLYIGLVLLVALSLDRARHVLAERRGARP
jgi:ribose transport system permease protein